jgi:hypothetical protein
MPLANAFRKKKDIAEKQYDLSVGFCSKCYLVQLMKHVSPQELFEDYVYFSSVTKSILVHSQKTSEDFIKRFHLNSKNLVMEVGSNDGVYLQFYKKKGIPVLGIDPAKNIAKVANKKGIKTLPEFFGLSLAKKLANKNIKADLFYGANVSAHVPQIVGFVKGVKVVLKDKGTAIFESPYLMGLLENKFDTIYHEHVFYYSLIALQNLFKTACLEIYDIKFVEMQGGSLRIFVSHTGVYKISARVTKLADKEINYGLDKIATYRKINKNIEKLKKDIVSLLKKIKKEGKNIVGYSAPAKGVILLNHFAIGKYLDFIVDNSKAKQDLYVPGTDMKVFPVEKIMESKPDYVFIFAWNIADEIMQQLHEYKKRGGKFIIPIPVIKIV